MLGALQDVILDVAHPIHLVARRHSPVEAAPAEVVFVWGRREVEGVEGQQVASHAGIHPSSHSRGT